jgi:hypothetical protein
VAIALPAAHADDPTRDRAPETTVIEFEVDTGAVDVDAQVRLDELAEWLRADPERHVVIAGPADGIDTMAERRAAAVRDYLVSVGIHPARIELRAAGESIATAERESHTMRIVFYTTRPEPVEPEEPIHTEATVEHLPPASQTNIEVHTAEPVSTRARVTSPMGISMTIGGGITNFVDDDMRGFADLGGTWEARLAVGTRTPIAGELGYVGTAQSVDALGLDRDAMLVSNGVEGAARFNLIREGLQPYVFGGVGWARYDVTRTDASSSSLRDQENIVYVPFGGGVGMYAAGLILDLRGTYRKAYRDEIARTPTGSTDTSVEMDSWTVAAKIGWEL